ncbi:MAG: hypothetical protein LLG20_08285 [Acidobacteriales bacterium]|nr:hypothetical protein [Terriglobales bacterium]
MKKVVLGVIAGLLLTGMCALVIARKGSAILYRKQQPMTADGEPAVLVLNPLRDRGPEVAAERFLRQLREGNCREAISGMPGYSNTKTCEHEEHSPLFSWDLRDRQDLQQKTELFYRCKADGGQSEGSLRVWVKRFGNRWAVADYERQ